VTGFALEVTLHWIAVGLYVVATGLLANAVIFGHSRRMRWGVLAAALGVFPHGAALVIRWIAVGHGPYLVRYEVLSSNAWIAVVALVLFLRRRPAWSALALVVLPAAILAVALGVFSSTEVRRIPPTLRSMWLVFHVSFAKLAAAAFLLSLAAAILQLVRARGASFSWLDRVPATDVLDAYTVRFVGFGFLFWTVAIAGGAIWANQSWGRYWGWDPIETWSLIAWLTYGSFLHARLFFRMRPLPTAWASVAAFAVFVLTLLVLPLLLPSIHSAYFQ
jgi:cytochrome c-type biogenesis protein CcsB